jgi:hypothetical protein
MADLVDMKYSKAELADEAKEGQVGPGGEPNPYPWGLAITLEDEELQKLGITDLPDVGDEVNFTAVAKVTSVNQSLNRDDPECRVGLQITMMAANIEAEEPGEKESPKAEKAETKSLATKYKG